MVEAEQFSAGLTLNGYHLIRLLGEGGAGSVFKARQISTEQVVAMKFLRQSADGDPRRSKRLVERFDRETRLCAHLHHPHIVRLLDKGQTEGQQLFAVFEFVPGETLKDLLLRKGALSALEAGELMGQVLDALACAHAQGIAHRDLKPQNIMVTHTGTRAHVKVLDFGIASFVADRQRPDEHNLTITQETMCSPSYSAPEQLRGEPPTIKTDLYAWGLLMIECLTGRPAIHGLTLAEIFHKQLSPMDVPLPPALLGHPLANLLRRVLRKNPAERAERAAALYDDFRRINLANIVGDLERRASDSAGPDQVFGMTTEQYHPGWRGTAYERQQITVLCCSLFVMCDKDGDADLEAREALQRDQQSLCVDTATRYGGHHAGSLGASMMFYFGYPHGSDNDARRAARTALELVSQTHRRSPLLERQQGLRLDIRIGIHTGIVLSRAGYLPSGLTPNTALLLAQSASPGAVLVSATARRMLEQYVEFDHVQAGVIKGGGAPLPYFSLAGEYPAEAALFLRGRAARHALVGRKRELAVLSEAWHATQNARDWQSGLARPTLIVGEAGIGKSRLAYELCVTVRNQGFTARECRCLPEHQNSALHPILAMLRTHLHLQVENPAEDAGAAGTTRAAVARLEEELARAGVTSAWALPILCSWLSLPLPLPLPDAAAPLQLSAERQKEVLLGALQSLILHLGAGRPFALVIEDIHWIDQTSFDLLARLVPAIPDRRGLMVLTARPGFDSIWRDEEMLLLELAPLSDGEVGQLIGELLGDVPIDKDASRELRERTDGIPLFVEELTSMLLDDKLLIQQDGAYRMALQQDAGAIPVTLRDLLHARLARMGGARETAQLAAAIGREFDHRLLVEVALADEAAVQTDIDALIAADLIHRQRQVQGDSYVFRHALIRDAAYDAMPRHIRHQTHLRIAQQLESRSEADVERNLSPLARHFAQATRFDSAVDYGSRAALLALKRALYDDAIELAKTVRNWAASLPDASRRIVDIDISRVLTNALMSKYGWADLRVKESAEYALSLVEGIDDLRQTVPTLWSLTFYHLVASHRAEVRQLSAQLIALSEQQADGSLRVASLTMRGIGCWIDADMGQAKRCFDAVLRHYDPVEHANHGYLFGVDSKVWSMAAMANVCWLSTTDDDAAFALARGALDHARALMHIPSLGLALMYLAMIHHYAGDRTGTRAVCEELIALSHKFGLPAVEGYAAIMHSWACSDLAAADQVLQGLKNIGCMLGLTFYSSMPAELEFEAGNCIAAMARIEACLRLCDDIDEPYFRPELLRRRALYRARLPNPDRQASCEDLRQATALAEAAGMRRIAIRAALQLAEFTMEESSTAAGMRQQAMAATSAI